MNRLISVIGLAPSELSFEKLLERLRLERDRVRTALERFRAQPVKKTRAPQTKTRSEELDIKKLLASGDITKEELMKIFEKGKKR